MIMLENDDTSFTLEDTTLFIENRDPLFLLSSPLHIIMI